MAEQSHPRRSDSEHPGPYLGKRNDYQKLSEYWAQRARHYESEAERLREAIRRFLDDEIDAKELRHAAL